MRQIKPLTSLRAFFAIWVLLRHWFHVFPETGVSYLDIGGPTIIFDKGYLGVDGFFILSGFILAYTYGSVRLNHRDFLVNRIARIYPVHIMCLALAAGVILIKQSVLHSQIIGTPGNTLTDLGLNILLLNTWLPTSLNGWNDVAWSVSAEWFAYVMFPVFIFFGSAKKVGALVAMLAMTFIVLLGLEHIGGHNHLSIARWLVRIVPEFYIGVLLYRLRDKVSALTSLRFGSITALAAVGAGLATGIDTICVAGFATLILALSSDRDVISKPMSLRPLIYLGEVSYCLYMVQRIPQDLWGMYRPKGIPVALDIAILAALCLASSIALHHCVERPARRVLRRWLSRPAFADITPSMPGKLQPEPSQ